MNKYFWIVLLICILPIKVQSQGFKKDSLILKVKTASPNEKVRLYLQLSNLAENYAQGIEYTANALNIANELKDNKLLADVNFKMGIVHYSEGKYIYSEKRFLEALGLYQKKSDTLSVATSYYWLALCNKDWGKYKKAIKYAQLGLDINKKIKSINGIVDATLVFGSIYQALGNQKQADKYFEKALKLIKREDQGSNLAFALLGKGNVCFSLSKIDSAKLYFEESYQIFLNLHDSYGQALSLRDLAHYYIYIKDFKKAESNIERSLDLLKEIKNKRGIFEVLILKGDMYFKKAKYPRAVELYIAGQNLAIEMQLQEEIVKNYKSISKAYEARKDNSKALKYYKLYSELKDSVIASKTSVQLTEMLTKFESEKKDNENKMLKIGDELKQSVIIRKFILVLSVIIVLVLLVVLAIYFFRSQQKERNNNQILEQQKKVIEISNEPISESINYASRIQAAMLTDTSLLKYSIKDHFVLYKPRDIVSGDFYWLKQIDNQLVVVVADCTGHGVPGAFMSILGISFLTDILSRQKILNAAEVLETMREKIKTSLKQDSSEKTFEDGMDMALCIVNTDTLELQYAGANMPLYLIRNGNIEIYKGTNNPIGIYLKEKPFENNQVQLMPEDNIYLFTDGYIDQFGGKNGEKFKPANFRNALLTICQNDMDTQKQFLEDIFEEWKNSKHDQTDDVLVFGMKV